MFGTLAFVIYKELRMLWKIRTTGAYSGQSTDVAKLDLSLRIIFTNCKLHKAWQTLLDVIFSL